MSEDNQIRRILLEIAYDGTEYHGWQMQPNGITVQEIIQQRLAKLFALNDIRIHGSSRTDCGVHAMGFAAHVTLPESPYIPFANLHKALNRMLPQSIRIRAIQEVGKEFHARFDAKGKAYTYVINRGEQTPFNARYSWCLPEFTDLAAARNVLNELTGTRDYSAFVAEANTYEDTVRTIYRIDMQEFGPYVCFTFVGNGFMYKMIRGLMGAISVVGMGKLAAEDIARIRDSHQRTARVETCPPQGLYLMKVFYNEDELHRFRLEQLPMFY